MENELKMLGVIALMLLPCFVGLLISFIMAPHIWFGENEPWRKRK